VRLQARLREYRVEAAWIAYRSGRSPAWLKMKNAAAPAVKREAEEDWGQGSNHVEHMTTVERIQAAKKKSERVVDHLLYLLALHENNAIIVYSNTLSSQIPYSHAANAFDVFRAGLHQFEIVRLCALWDRAEEAKENIPTMVELIDDPGVMNALAEEARSPWMNNTGTILNRSNDLQLRNAEEEELKRIDERFGQGASRQGPG
jgi:AbiU2